MNADTIEVKIGALLTTLGLTVALAESCTGGQIGDRLPDIPGTPAPFSGRPVHHDP